MAKPVIGLRWLGRFGNNLFQYAHARAHAERNGATLCTDPWIGQKIFEIDDPPVPAGLPRRDENTIGENEVNVELRTYAQNQHSIDLYSREKVRRWFKLRHEIRASLERRFPLPDACVAHRRVGDYPGYHFCVVSKESYEIAARNLGIHFIRWITEEEPTLCGGFDGEMAMLPDFYRMMNADVLLRGNSSFSFWASVLGRGVTHSPLVGDKGGGIDHLCDFVLGNHPKLSHNHFCTDLHLKEN